MMRVVDAELDFLSVEMKTTLHLDADDDDAAVIEHDLTVMADEEHSAIGEASVSEIRIVYNGDESDDEHFPLMDSLSQETYELHEAIREHMTGFAPDGITSLVHIEKLRIKPEWRGKGLGRRVLRSIMTYWGEHAGVPSHMFLFARPMLDEGTTPHDDRQQWKERDPDGYLAASQRLRKLYGSLGFRPVGNTDFMVFGLEQRIPD